MFDGGPRVASAIALEPSTILRIPRDQWLLVVDEIPEFTRRMLLAIGASVRQYTSHAIDFLFLDVEIPSFPPAEDAPPGMSVVTKDRLDLTRQQILAFRRHVGALDERLPRGRRSLRLAAWAGLKDSMPRAALLSIHARVEGTQPSTWEDPSLVQLWGPHHHAYVVAARDLGVFSLGRLPDDNRSRQVAEDLATRLRAHLGEETITYGEAGSALGEPPNRLRYAAPTGTVVIRWDGARQPTIRTVPPPEVDPGEARLELVRRFLHIFGPATPEAFAEWSAIPAKRAHAAFDALGGSLTPARTPIGDAWILTRDEPTFAVPSGSVGVGSAPAERRHLLPAPGC